MLWIETPHREIKLSVEVVVAPDISEELAPFEVLEVSAALDAFDAGVAPEEEKFVMLCLSYSYLPFI